MRTPLENFFLKFPIKINALGDGDDTSNVFKCWTSFILDQPCAKLWFIKVEAGPFFYRDDDTFVSPTFKLVRVLWNLMIQNLFDMKYSWSTLNFKGFSPCRKEIEKKAGLIAYVY